MAEKVCPLCLPLPPAASLAVQGLSASWTAPHCRHRSVQRRTYGGWVEQEPNQEDWEWQEDKLKTLSADLRSIDVGGEGIDLLSRDG